MTPECPNCHKGFLHYAMNNLDLVCYQCGYRLSKEAQNAK